MKFLKYLISIIFCNAFRLLRFIPNNDPIMGCMLPFSRQDKWWQGALFAFITMISFDLMTSGIGIWTLATAGTYAGLGLGFHLAYKRIGKVKLKHYLGSGIIGVLVFDFVTGVLLGPTMFGMNYMQALIGQIPFTIVHLLTVTAFILILTPVFDTSIVNNPALEDSAVLSKIKMLVRV